MHWRLGIDLGTNSLGWWAMRVTHDGPAQNGKKTKWRVVQSLDGGSYIFPDGREKPKGGRVGNSLAVARRLSRAMRRNRDRGNNRTRFLARKLIDLGLLPEDEGEREALFRTAKKTSLKTDRYNPYRLRAEALERPLSPHELGRALLHLAMRRGYKSNRKVASDEDGGKLKERIGALKEHLGERTLGQYLWESLNEDFQREQNGERRKGVRFRAENDYYPDRAMYAEELSAIAAHQKDHHALSEDDWQRIGRCILDQRPLRPVERGWCEFYPDQHRHWKDTPIAHDFRIHQELNALRWIDEANISHPLSAAQRAAVLDKLMTQKSEVTFKSLRKLKDQDITALFPPHSRFNLEDAKRKGLKPHKIATVMKADCELSALWAEREAGDEETLDDIFEVLHRAEDDAQARTKLIDTFALPGAIADKLMAIGLSAGTTSISRRFMSQIVPILADQGLIFSDAVRELSDDNGDPLHHSLHDDGRRWDVLPYYGEVLSASMLGADPSCDPIGEPEKHFGKINNPTVHIALNSLRRIVNTLSKRFGAAPVEIHVELTRDLKLPRKKRDEINKKQAANKKGNDDIRTFCAENEIPDPSARDIKKVKLWEELGDKQLSRCCVFSGKPISAAQLFNGEAEIEHILPFSRTLDGSMGNLTVSLRWVNRLKGNNTPYEAFHGDRHADRGILWTEILERAARLPKNKRDRFSTEAMARFEKDGGFIARQLNDTAYMSRAATRYLKALKGVETVRANPGRLTAMVRGKWGLNGILNDDNRKTREDHRHHAIDAAVIALIDGQLLNRISRLTARGADDLVHIALPNLDDTLHEAITKRVPTIITAVKPDHALQGRMSKETAYGFIPKERTDPDLPNYTLITRKDLAGLTPKECEAIRDRKLRRIVRDRLYEAKGAGVKHEAALSDLAKETGIKRVRVLIADQTITPVPSAPYKGYAPASYVCCDIWEIPPRKKKNGKFGKPTWTGAFWSYDETVGCDASRGEPDKSLKKPHPAARFLTRLFKDDMIAYEEGRQTRIMRVYGFSTTNNKLDIRPHNAANAKQNHVGINVLGAKGLRRLFVTPDGRILETKRGKAS